MKVSCNERPLKDDENKTLYFWKKVVVFKKDRHRKGLMTIASFLFWSKRQPYFICKLEGIVCCPTALLIKATAIFFFLYLTIIIFMANKSCRGTIYFTKYTTFFSASCSVLEVALTPGNFWLSSSSSSEDSPTNVWSLSIPPGTSLVLINY